MDDINIAYANVRSITAITELGSRVDHIQHLLLEPNNCSIFCCTETHLNDSVDDDVIMIPSYSILRNDRNRHGGGTAIYIRESLKYKRRNDFELPRMELIWVELTISSNCIFLIGVCYRPPNQTAHESSEFLSNLALLFDNIFAAETIYSSVILFGDFNDACTLWESNHAKSEINDKLLLLSQSLNLHQLINKPTRGNNILDLIFSNFIDKIHSVEVLDPIHELDHLPIVCRLACANTCVMGQVKCLTRHVFHYNNGDYEKLSHLIHDAPWPALLTGDTDNMQVVFSNHINDMISECIPNYHVKIKTRDKPGMTNKIKNLFKKANKLHKRALYTKHPRDIEKHASARRLAKCEFKKISV